MGPEPNETDFSRWWLEMLMNGWWATVSKKHTHYVDGLAGFTKP